MRTDTCLLEIKLVASLNFYGTGFNKNRPFYVLFFNLIYMHACLLFIKTPIKSLSNKEIRNFCVSQIAGHAFNLIACIIHVKLHIYYSYIQ